MCGDKNYSRFISELMRKQENIDHKVLGIDIGGTGIKAAAVDVDSGAIVKEPLKYPTPQPSTPDSVFSVIEKIVDQFEWNGPVGCGVPGIVKHDEIQLIANLDQAWVGVNLQKELSGILGKRVCVGNDADAAGLAEMRFGAGSDRDFSRGDVVLFLTLGTGIGSALFRDGCLIPNTEFGLLEMEGDVAEKQAATVVREREQLCWEEWGGRVNRYLNLMDRLLSPDCIIIGGGVSAEFHQFSSYLQTSCDIIPARLKNNAGMIGAALLCERADK
jgi:polyphosphate glucokinase